MGENLLNVGVILTGDLTFRLKLGVAYSKIESTGARGTELPHPLFSSPGPKVQVNYCHHLASVVCRLSSVNFSHFKLLLRNHLADWNRT